MALDKKSFDFAGLNRVAVLGRQPTSCTSILVIEPEYNYLECRYTSEEELCSFLTQQLDELKANCNGFDVVGLDCEWVDIHRYVKKPFWPSEKLYGYYEVPHHSWLDENANKGNVSLLQIANIFGNVLLIRLCFFERMPSSLREFLEDPSWLKVGCAIDDDAKRLKSDWSVSLRGYLDLRFVIFRHPSIKMEAGRNTPAKTSLQSVANRLFDCSDWKLSEIQRSNWNRYRLLDFQIDYAARDAVTGMDIFAFVLPFLVEMSENDIDDPKTYDALLFKTIKLKLEMLAAIDQPYTGCVASKNSHRFQETATVFDDFFHYEFDSRKGRFDEATAQTYNLIAVGPYEDDDYFVPAFVSHPFLRYDFMDGNRQTCILGVQNFAERHLVENAESGEALWLGDFPNRFRYSIRCVGTRDSPIRLHFWDPQVEEFPSTDAPYCRCNICGEFLLAEMHCRTTLIPPALKSNYPKKYANSFCACNELLLCDECFPKFAKFQFDMLDVLSIETGIKFNNVHKWRILSSPDDFEILKLSRFLSSIFEQRQNIEKLCGTDLERNLVDRLELLLKRKGEKFSAQTLYMLSFGIPVEECRLAENSEIDFFSAVIEKQTQQGYFIDRALNDLEVLYRNRFVESLAPKSPPECWNEPHDIHNCFVKIQTNHIPYPEFESQPWQFEDVGVDDDDDESVGAFGGMLVDACMKGLPAYRPQYGPESAANGFAVFDGGNETPTKTESSWTRSRSEGNLNDSSKTSVAGQNFLDLISPLVQQPQTGNRLPVMSPSRNPVLSSNDALNTRRLSRKALLSEDSFDSASYIPASNSKPVHEFPRTASLSYAKTKHAAIAKNPQEASTSVDHFVNTVDEPPATPSSFMMQMDNVFYNFDTIPMSNVVPLAGFPPWYIPHDNGGYIQHPDFIGTPFGFLSAQQPSQTQLHENFANSLLNLNLQEYFAIGTAALPNSSQLTQVAPAIETTETDEFVNCDQLPQQNIRTQQYEQYANDSNQEFFIPLRTGPSNNQSISIDDPAVIYAEKSGASNDFASMVFEGNSDLNINFNADAGGPLGVPPRYSLMQSKELPPPENYSALSCLSKEISNEIETVDEYVGVDAGATAFISDPQPRQPILTQKRIRRKDDVPPISYRHF